MSVVALIASKGGAGKSTVAVHLAVAAALRKRRPLLIDFDTKQLSILTWSKGFRSKAKSPAVIRGVIETLLSDIADAKRKHDLIIIDVAAGGGDDVCTIATIADHILVPVRPSTFDMSATRNTVDLLRKAADNTEPEEIAFRNALGKAAIVLNGAPKKQTAKWRRDIEASLEASGAGALRVLGALADRAAYKTAIENGQGVTEDGDDDAAIDEIFTVYDGLVSLEEERRKKLASVRRGR